MAALGEDPSCCVDEAKKPPSGTTLERFMVQKGPVLDKEVLDRLIAEFVATDEQPIAKKREGLTTIRLVDRENLLRKCIVDYH